MPFLKFKITLCSVFWRVKYQLNHQKRLFYINNYLSFCSFRFSLRCRNIICSRSCRVFSGLGVFDFATWSQTLSSMDFFHSSTGCVLDRSKNASSSVWQGGGQISSAKSVRFSKVVLGSEGTSRKRFLKS